MELFGIGPLELIAILLIVFIVMGPSDMVKMGGTIGRAVRNFRGSALWASFTDATRQLRELPKSLMQETGMEEIEALRQDLTEDLDAQKSQLDDLNRQFVAWTRQPDPQSHKQNPPSETDPEESQEA